jgi:hypothetical protein
MPNSYRIRTQLGAEQVLQVNLEQEFDSLDILSLSIYPNDIYTRNCADFGVVCGRVFCNRGFGLVNARVAIFIPIDEIDELNPLISTLYPYKSFEDFNEDGYKFNLLPYTQSHSGHVPVGTFPDRIDALTNPTVVQVYDKYYKFTAKTNDAGDFMLFGLPIGQHNLFMQIDLSDIGEFSLTPQDLIRMGRATESQVNGTTFKFSENYSELPQIVTLKKIVQVAPFYGERGVCDHFITRVDFDLTSESQIELQPTSVFMGSMISTNERKKLPRTCRVPAKQGWLCDMVTGPGQIETLRQTIFTDTFGRPILEDFKLQNDGRLIDADGTWLVELPMNLDYVYTDENGDRRISPDGKVGVPTRGKYRFKIKWQQSPSLTEQSKRGYFLVPNIKEYGWIGDEDDPGSDPVLDGVTATGTYTLSKESPLPPTPPSSGPFVETINYDIPPNNWELYYMTINGFYNIDSYEVLIDGVPNIDYLTVIPFIELPVGTVVEIKYTLEDPTVDGNFRFTLYTELQYALQASYAFSLNWKDYGTPTMVQEAINCEDRFYEFTYNKVYTISQLLDRYSNRIFPQKSIQVKHITESKCEGDYNPFPVNDTYYRYDIFYILFSFLLTILKFVLIPVLVVVHVLAFIWPVYCLIVYIIYKIQLAIYKICRGIEKAFSGLVSCGGEPVDPGQDCPNPFKNLKVPLFLYTEDGCERCDCKIDTLDLSGNETAFILQANITQIDFVEASNVASLGDPENYGAGIAGPGGFYWEAYGTPTGQFGIVPTYRWGELYYAVAAYGGAELSNSDYLPRTQIMLAGDNSEEPKYKKLPISIGSIGNANVDVFSTSLTLAEKLNLFNTKAKFFDNINTTSEPISDGGAGTNQRVSPGNVGWNQIKVQIAPTLNTAPDQYHYDNVIVLLMDPLADYSQGDILTFQDPGRSFDPNIDNETSMVRDINLNQITIRCANPDYRRTNGLGDYIETIYTVPNPNIILDSFGNPVAASQDRRRVKPCFKTDIEYFQVIKVERLEDFMHKTRISSNEANALPNDHPFHPAAPNPPFNLAFNSNFSSFDADKRYSLPFRFLRGNFGARKTSIGSGNSNDSRACNGFITPDGCYDKRKVFTNSTQMYETFSVNPNGCNSCGVACRSHTTYQKANLDPVRSLSGWTNHKVMFLVRGVDPNSDRVQIRYDLRRLYGVADYNTTPTNGMGEDLTTDVIVTGSFKLNVPIQAGGTDPDKNVGGLMLTRHNEVLNNENLNSDTFGEIFFPGFYYRYDPDEYISYETIMPTFYSALDSNAVYNLFDTGYKWQLTQTFNAWTLAIPDFFPVGIGATSLEAIGVVNSSRDGFVTTTDANMFSQVLAPQIIDGSVGYNALSTSFRYPCSKSYLSSPPGSVLSYNCGNEVDDANGAEGFCPGAGECNCTLMNGSDNDFFGECPGCCKFRRTLFRTNKVYHSNKYNWELNNLSGYWAEEYVEGGSAFAGELGDETDKYESNGRSNCVYSNPDGGFIDNEGARWANINQDGEDESSQCAPNCDGASQTSRKWNASATGYWSPVYAAFTTTEINPNVLSTYNPSNDPVYEEYLRKTWYVQSMRTTQMFNPTNMVFRTDRLPSSTGLQTDGNGNGYLLHQAQGFAVFKITGCNQFETTGESFISTPQSTDVDYDTVPGGSGGAIATVATSLNSCSDAVDLNSYGVDDDGNPFIHNQGLANPQNYSEQDNKDYVWFDRGTGCYNFVSYPLKSLAKRDIPGDPGGSVECIPKKYYSDIFSLVEWIQRLKVTFAACFEVFSHTFSNNWINGTLYAFPFQNFTTFDSQNRPVRRYCNHVVYLHNPQNTFYYRSSPWGGGQFIGRPRYTGGDDKYGNLRNLLYPTTILDMGPKAEFIQELAYSDDYDGYIVQKVPSTSFGKIDEMLNMFILSRLVSTTFISQLFPFPDDNGNEGTNDPSVTAFFSNKRWANGDDFFNGFLPGLVDGDYSQMLSINSEFGVREYNGATYSNDAVFFRFTPQSSSVVKCSPFFGILFSGDNQNRDYISPRRTIWNPDAEIPVNDSEFNEITNVKTQVVPFYQWHVYHGADFGNTIFGYQSNDFYSDNGTNPNFPNGYFAHEYQKLDRFNDSSEYFKPDGDYTFTYKGFIINYSSSTLPTGEITYAPIEDQPANPTGRYTFGAPFQFYFGLKKGASAMDRFITKYVDTNLIYD